MEDGKNGGEQCFCFFSSGVPISGFAILHLGGDWAEEVRQSLRSVVFI